MESDTIINQRLMQISDLKKFLGEVESQLISISKNINWDYRKLVEEVKQ